MCRMRIIATSVAMHYACLCVVILNSDFYDKKKKRHPRGHLMGPAPAGGLEGWR